MKKVVIKKERKKQREKEIFEDSSSEDDIDMNEEEQRAKKQMDILTKKMSSAVYSMSIIRNQSESWGYFRSHYREMMKILNRNVWYKNTRSTDKSGRFFHILFDSELENENWKFRLPFVQLANYCLPDKMSTEYSLDYWSFAHVIFANHFKSKLVTDGNSSKLQSELLRWLEQLKTYYTDGVDRLKLMRSLKIIVSDDWFELLQQEREIHETQVQDIVSIIKTWLSAAQLKENRTLFTFITDNREEFHNQVDYADFDLQKETTGYVPYSEDNTNNMRNEKQNEAIIKKEEITSSPKQEENYDLGPSFDPDELTQNPDGWGLPGNIDHAPYEDSDDDNQEKTIVVPPSLPSLI
jgi:hypothetical protein